MATPLVRTPGWSRTQGVLTPPTRAQPGDPPLWSRFVYLGLGERTRLPPRRNPPPAGLLLFTSQLPKSNHDGPQLHRPSPIICFGAHQYPNSNMSNVLTIYLTLVGTLLHNTFSNSTARTRLGSEKQKGGRVGLQSVGQTQHPSRNCGISAKGGRGKTKNSIAFGSAPRREVDSQPFSPCARPAVSETETHSLGFLSVADASPSSGAMLRLRSSSC